MPVFCLILVSISFFTALARPYCGLMIPWASASAVSEWPVAASVSMDSSALSWGSNRLYSLPRMLSLPPLTVVATSVARLVAGSRT